MSDSLGVWHGERLVGTLRRGRGDRLSFEYASPWLDDPHAFAISVSLPLVAGPIEGQAAHAFFANLLPEGQVRVAVARRLGLSASNDFGLLEAIGGECAGALAVLPGSARPSGGAAVYESLAPETVAELARRHSVLAELVGTHGARLSLAGAQDKLPVRFDPDGSLWLPLGGAPSTHILKIPSRDFKHLPANEVLVTKLARALALETVEADLLRVAGTEVAVTRRYDRVVDGAAIVRLHQEDMCQALGLMPGTKYEQEGGPSFTDSLGIVRMCSAEPLIDAVQMLRWLLFALLAGNSDGHGKNVSLVHTRGGGLRLAPFYDLVCTRVYPRLDRRQAMGIGGERDPGQIGRSQLETLATEADVGKRLVLREVKELATAMPTAFDEVATWYITAHGSTPIIERLRRAIRDQCRRTLRLLAARN